MFERDNLNPTEIQVYGSFPLKLWKKELENHPNRDFILDGLENRFRIGVDTDKLKDGKLSTKRTYVYLDKDVQEAICEMFVKGINKGFISGPYRHLTDLPDFIQKQGLHISPIFAVKQTNKIRPIHHLSYPKNKKCNKQQLSVNDILKDEYKTAQYTTFKEVVRMILKAGPNHTCS